MLQISIYLFHHFLFFYFNVLVFSRFRHISEIVYNWNFFLSLWFTLFLTFKMTTFIFLVIIDKFRLVYSPLFYYFCLSCFLHLFSSSSLPLKNINMTSSHLFFFIFFLLLVCKLKYSTSSFFRNLSGVNKV